MSLTRFSLFRGSRASRVAKGSRFCVASPSGCGRLMSTASTRKDPTSRAEEIWSLFDKGQKGSELQSEGVKVEETAATPPAWFETLCRDLHFRTNSNDDYDKESSEMASVAFLPSGNTLEVPKEGSSGSEGEGEVVDPFLWLDFKLKSPEEYEVGPFKFPEGSNHGEVFYSDSDRKQKLLLESGESRRQFLCFCEAYPFPDRSQIPTSLGDTPCKLLVEPSATVPVVYIQLGADFPPSMWLPVKPTAQAIRRVLAEFAQQAAMHRDAHHMDFERKRLQAIEKLKLQGMFPNTVNGEDMEFPAAGESQTTQKEVVDDLLHRKRESAILRYMGKDARTAYTIEVDWKEYPNYQEFFLGEHRDPEHFMEFMDTCPFTFALPLMRTATNLTDERYTPTITGPGIATSLYRTIYSKSLLFAKVHLGTEVKLPPQDLDSFRYLWKDSGTSHVPESRVPVFCRAVWPINKRMCGGGGVIARFNDLLQTEFSLDMPVDTALAMYFTMSWTRKSEDFLGIQGMRNRLKGLEQACFEPHRPKLYPGTRDIPNPDYTPQELLGMHVQYLAHLGDPEIEDTIRRLRAFASAPVRMGCAKAALESGNKKLFREIVSSEPPGRMQDYMTKLIVKRKARDWTDPNDRYLDSQYEFDAPLWSGSRRLDPTNSTDAVAIARMRATGRYGKNTTKGVKRSLDHTGV